MAAAASEARPRVRVAAFIVIDGSVVLVRHRTGSATYHLLPGGGVDYRETLETALVREVKEETGLDVRIGKLLFVNDTIDPHGTRHVVNLTFRAEVIGGSITATPQDSRVEAVDRVSPDILPSIDLRPPMASDLIGALNRDAPGKYLGSLFTPDRS